jgi:menaquinone-dependent protoporphyrinogen oxidase
LPDENIRENQIDKETMNNKILIAYASKYGATAEIAEKIGEDLKTSGFEVDTLPANKVKDISGYQSVILGTALYMGQWRKEAVQFLKSNQGSLAKQPVYIFTSGPTGEGDPAELLQGKLVPENLKSVLEGIQPKEVTVFGGKSDTEKMNGFDRWIMKNVKAASGDFRNWQAISAWTSKISVSLKTNA